MWPALRPIRSRWRSGRAKQAIGGAPLGLKNKIAKTTPCKVGWAAQLPFIPLQFPVAPQPANFYVDHPNPKTPWSPKWISPRCLRRDPHSFRKLSMTALVILDLISLATPDRLPLFHGLSPPLARERISIVGPFGCGPWALLRFVAARA